MSPATVRLRAEVLADLPAVARPLTLSLYPHATLAQLRLTAAVAALFAVVLDVYRDPARVRRLLSTVTIVGGAVALVAAYQNLTGATTV